MPPRSERAAAAPPVRLARAVTYGLLAAMVGTVATGSELWPLSQFELFSGVRTGTSVTWQLVTVDGQGEETVVDLGGLPPNLDLVHHLLPGLRDQSLPDQQEAARRWLEAADTDDPATVAVRVYAVRRTVPIAAEGVSAELERSLTVEIPLQ